MNGGICNCGDPGANGHSPFVKSPQVGNGAFLGVGKGRRFIRGIYANPLA